MNYTELPAGSLVMSKECEGDNNTLNLLMVHSVVSGFFVTCRHLKLGEYVSKRAKDLIPVQLTEDIVTSLFGFTKTEPEGHLYNSIIHNLTIRRYTTPHEQYSLVFNGIVWPIPVRYAHELQVLISIYGNKDEQ